MSPEADETPRSGPQWSWRTFPVFAAFFAGLLIASVVNGQPNNIVAGALQIIALLGVGYALAHMIVTNVLRAGRARRAEKASDDEYEDTIVYPEDARPE